MNGNRLLKLSAVTVIALTFTGCSTKNGSYFNILQLPGEIWNSVFDKKSCHIKQKKVKEYTIANYKRLRDEIKSKKWKHSDELMKLSEIDESSYSKMREQLYTSYDTIFHNTKRVTEKLVQNMSRLYEVKEKTKLINGFSYKEISDITEKFVSKNFEKIRLAVKSKESEIFIPLAKELKIEDKTKQKSFINSLSGKHFELYDDLLVVAVMVEGI